MDLCTNARKEKNESESSSRIVWQEFIFFCLDFQLLNNQNAPAHKRKFKKVEVIYGKAGT